MGDRNRGALEAFELLPPNYRNERRVRQVVRGWVVIVGAMLVIFGSVFATASIRSRHEARIREQVAAAAKPQFDLRRSVLHLEAANERRQQWCQWVESARPHDDAFQTLASITAAANGEGMNIKFDRVHVKLPLEYPATETSPPDWALPSATIIARVQSPEVMNRWLAQLKTSDRLAAATIDDDPSGDIGQQYEVTASPVATRVLP